MEEREDSLQPADEEVAERALDSLYNLEEGVEREPAQLRMRLKELLERIVDKKVEAYMADSIAPPEERRGPLPNDHASCAPRCDPPRRENRLYTAL